MKASLRALEAPIERHVLAMESKLRQPGWARRAREGRVTSLPPIRSLSRAAGHLEGAIGKDLGRMWVF